MIGRFDLSRLEEQLEVITYWFIGLTILWTLTMALALRLALDRLVVEPIFELAQSADDITKGRMDRRAWVASSDEIGRLAVDFNAMADQLQVYTEKLERSRLLRFTISWVKAGSSAPRSSKMPAKVGIRKIVMPRKIGRAHV